MTPRLVNGGAVDARRGAGSGARDEREGIGRERGVDVAALVAHELRSPLAVLRLQGYKLARGEGKERLDAEAVRKIGETILRCTSRMVMLAEDLSEDARLAGRRVPLDLGVHRASELLDDVAELRPLAAPRGLELVIGEPSPDGEIACDRRRMAQVLANLVGNAFKFSPPGARVTVEASVGADVARFVVRDQGPGIAPEDAARIFDRFWSSDAAGGVGLGLFIARAVARAHGGDIDVASPPGGGASF
ncbi:MAG TPA: HAMP domain-containing sensor histidine kinase, partial [Minicystis sp.]|nr:HAMP domain-containing sensor histidine kinase [Minicystis sp.]